ncbi:hypothetical protein F5Y15DRAFT_374953 [Xylariaceae sp. FL0016]|nr:hypothetical protein F5Y15DRAFT_374953 [Xylariaceae sp. FL0016]
MAFQCVFILVRRTYNEHMRRADRLRSTVHFQREFIIKDLGRLLSDILLSPPQPTSYAAAYSIRYLAIHTYTALIMLFGKKKEIVDKIEADGHKITKEDVMHAWHVPPNGTSEIPWKEDTPRPQHMWLEKGRLQPGQTRIRAGYGHILHKHQKDFVERGFAPETLQTRVPQVAEASTTVGRHVGYISNKMDRPVMATYMKDEQKVLKTGVTISTNGFIVRMNPIKNEKIKREEGRPQDVSDETLKNLYYYPPNRPDRRGTANDKESQRYPAPSVHKSW